ncbi:serine hydrolase [Streptomyces sp. NPDC102274]|uniref:serine hydrolase n=1 Tax=Streptomyces sp. NPDC102274 TaxID=3366151 RepID=UPI00382D629F
MNTEALLSDMRGQLRDGGLRGCLLVRDLHTGEELGIDPDTQLPAASLVKVPLALATAERIRRGELDGATMLDVQPGRITTPGPTGLSRFRHPTRIAIDDLLYLSTCISDGTAADALFDLTPPARVADILHELGLRGLTVRHGMLELTDTPVERFDAAEAHFAHSLAIDAGTSGRGHRVPQLDTTRANSGSARAYVELLQALWTPSAIHPEAAERVRGLMAHNMLRHRLTPDSLAVALLVFGFGNGCLDVSMNTHAVQVERGYERPVMSAFHAFFSVGGVLAALVGARTLSWDWSAALTLTSVSVFGLAVTGLFAPALLRRSAPRPRAGRRRSTASEAGGGPDPRARRP